MQLNQASQAQLSQWQSELTAEYQALQQQHLNLDLTRGKPSTEQLSLSDALDGILNGNYTTADGTDARNYGGIDGIAEAKALGANILQVNADEILVGGNSSLTLMHQTLTMAYLFGFNDPASAWKNETAPKFLCPVPGYDRHFSICEQLGIEMITVPMTATGPDMDQVEAMIKADSSIKGMWCVPKYSNPTGVTYSDETVDRIAQLGKIASGNFRVMWDNAYAVHGLTDTPQAMASIMAACRKHNTEDSVIQFASTSKITHAGSGIAFMASAPSNLKAFKAFLGIGTIGPDKVNQLRHMKLIPNMDALQSHMAKHTAIIKPRFDSVLRNLDAAFSDSDLGAWEKPEGGYFISFDAQSGCAQRIVQLAAEAGVKLTPAGATYPYSNDPEDRNIRIAPTVPTVEQVETAMQVFIVCVKLASVEAKLAA